MYPHKIVFGLTLYDLLICVGIIACFFSFSYLADRSRIKNKLQSYSMIVGVMAIALGFGSAILFQALYNVESTGKFEIVTNTGATFYGGLIGGVTVFLVLYFGFGGLVFKTDALKGYHKNNFFNIARCGAPSIVVAHAFGRIGCLTAGCCHGAPTDSWLGILMYGDMGYRKYVPVQLFEAIFLFALFALLFMRARDGKRYNLSVYVMVYGVWRFVVEYLRRDYRGSISFTSLTPSQFIAVLMVLAGVGLIFLERYICNRIERNAEQAAESAAESAVVKEDRDEA
ncbi:MAG: prolipoprotein diacylglyceryl transferase [Clostridia bacterium]|nr:prolipoprotein diacylglyceryl transferase [Clostridia bacterium]